MSKIHSESKSQRYGNSTRNCCDCVSLCQRYILKANHNWCAGIIGTIRTVSHYVKDTFWKQITTIQTNTIFTKQLCLTMSKIHSESKSQRVYANRFPQTDCVSLCQRYILKANHNMVDMITSALKTVSHYVKDTFWKQITTGRSH